MSAAPGRLLSTLRGAAVTTAVLAGVLLLSPDALSWSVGTVQPTPTSSVPTTLPQLSDGAGRIVQRPESGRPAEGPGDPGGWMQSLLFLLILSAVATIGFLVWRDSSKKRRSR